MIIIHIYTGCLAQGTYYIECDGEAVLIDPLRETGPYMERASQSGARIKYILETHFHADFVSGHLDLNKQTGATIVYGPNATADFPFMTLLDGEELKLGRCTIQLLHTPGHTLESSCYLLKDEKGVDRALFTGDTLFIGDVGRPDLAQYLYPDLTPEKLAGQLYDSLRNKIMPLGNDVVIYPGHGAGSACGKNLDSQPWDTLGHQKNSNYALQPGLAKEAFIKEVTSGLTAPPAYFPANVSLNKKGYEVFDTVLQRGRQALSPDVFELAADKQNMLILDTRNAKSFAQEFIPGSINIGIDGNFAPWAGTMIPDVRQPVLLVTDKGREDEVITRLARVGIDHCIGFLEGGVDAWVNAGKYTEDINSVTATELSEIQQRTPVHILDVRRYGEFEQEHVLHAINMPLEQVDACIPKIIKEDTYYVYCAGGYRSMLFISILRAKGYQNLIDVTGGYKAIRDSGKLCITNDFAPEEAPFLQVS